MSGIFYRLNRGEIVPNSRVAPRAEDMDREPSRYRDNTLGRCPPPMKEEETAAAKSGGCGIGETGGDRDGVWKSSRPLPLHALKQAGARGVLLKMKAKMEEAMRLEQMVKDASEEDQLQLSFTPRSDGSEDSSMDSWTEGARDTGSSTAPNGNLSTRSLDSLDCITDEKQEHGRPAKKAEESTEDEETSESDSDREPASVSSPRPSNRPRFKLLIPSRDCGGNVACLDLPVRMRGPPLTRCFLLCFLWKQPEA